MENDLKTLETKVTQLIGICNQLRAENHQLRQDLANALSANRQYSDKIDTATARLEKLLGDLPEEQA